MLPRFFTSFAAILSLKLDIFHTIVLHPHPSLSGGSHPKVSSKPHAVESQVYRHHLSPFSYFLDLSTQWLTGYLFLDVP